MRAISYDYYWQSRARCSPNWECCKCVFSLPVNTAVACEKPFGHSVTTPGRVICFLPKTTAGFIYNRTFVKYYTSGGT